MKLNLKKTPLVNLSRDNQVLPNELTPQVGGGGGSDGVGCTIGCTVGCTVGGNTKQCNEATYNGCAPGTIECMSYNDCTTVGGCNEY